MFDACLFLLISYTGHPIVKTIGIHPMGIEFSLFPIIFHRTNRKPFTLFCFQTDLFKPYCPPVMGQPGFVVLT